MIFVHSVLHQGLLLTQSGNSSRFSVYKLHKVAKNGPRRHRTLGIGSLFKNKRDVSVVITDDDHAGANISASRGNH
jgi:hypothetical protein